MPSKKCILFVLIVFDVACRHDTEFSFRFLDVFYDKGDYGIQIFFCM